MVLTSQNDPDLAGSGPRWSTSCFGHSCDTSPVELHALGSHLQQCQNSSTSLHALQRATQAVHGFVAQRFVSTLGVLVLLVVAILALVVGLGGTVLWLPW